jgi:hypothetical protein
MSGLPPLFTLVASRKIRLLSFQAGAHGFLVLRRPVRLSLFEVCNVVSESQ